MDEGRFIAVSDGIATVIEKHFGTTWGAVEGSLHTDLLEFVDECVRRDEGKIAGWQVVADGRQELIDTLKVEKRQLASEVDRLNRLLADRTTYVSGEYLEKVGASLNPEYIPFYDALKAKYGGEAEK